MKKYEYIKAKYREKAFPIIDERTFDAAVSEILDENDTAHTVYIAKMNAKIERLENENAYLRRLAFHALSSWAIGMSLANHYLAEGSKKKQIAYYMVYKKFENLHNKEKQKWRAENERQKTISH